MAWKQRLGNGVVSKLMGGTPDQYPDRYDAGSPIELLPTGTTQVVVHGTADIIVPVSQSERFVERAKELGEQPTLVKLEEVGHFELIDPESDTWRIVARAVLPLLGLK
jgi:dipeptidyl aminopeptidase/acylaminoacyl peptidase